MNVVVQRAISGDDYVVRIRLVRRIFEKSIHLLLDVGRAAVVSHDGTVKGELPSGCCDSEHSSRFGMNSLLVKERSRVENGDVLCTRDPEEYLVLILYRVSVGDRHAVQSSYIDDHATFSGAVGHCAPDDEYWK